MTHGAQREGSCHWPVHAPHLPAALLESLQRDLQLDGREPAEAPRATYGARPTEELVADAWVTLREHWLASGSEALASVADALWQSGGANGYLPPQSTPVTSWTAPTFTADRDIPRTQGRGHTKRSSTTDAPEKEIYSLDKRRRDHPCVPRPAARSGGCPHSHRPARSSGAGMTGRQRRDIQPSPYPRSAWFRCPPEPQPPIGYDGGLVPPGTRRGRYPPTSSLVGRHAQRPPAAGRTPIRRTSCARPTSLCEPPLKAAPGPKRARSEGRVILARAH